MWIFYPCKCVADWMLKLNQNACTQLLFNQHQQSMWDLISFGSHTNPSLYHIYVNISIYNIYIYIKYLRNVQFWPKTPVFGRKNYVFLCFLSKVLGVNLSNIYNLQITYLTKYIHHLLKTLKQTRQNSTNPGNSATFFFGVLKRDLQRWDLRCQVEALMDLGGEPWGTSLVTLTPPRPTKWKEKNQPVELKGFL